MSLQKKKKKNPVNLHLAHIKNMIKVNRNQIKWKWFCFIPLACVSG